MAELSRQNFTRKHYPYRLPENMLDVDPDKLPLYLLVALWAIRTGKPVTVRDVRGAFGLTLRRASDVLEYMTEQGGPGIEVHCELRPLGQGDMRVRREWRVITIGSDKIVRSTKKTGMRTSNSAASCTERAPDVGDLRRWFLSRPVGRAVPDDFRNDD